MEKKLGRILILVIVCCIVFCGFTLESLTLYNENIVNGGEFGEYNVYKPNPLFELEFENNTDNENTFKHRFFDFFKFNRNKKTTLSSDEVYLGGQPLGVSIGVRGVIIAGISDVITNSGVESPAKLTSIKAGDILIAINENEILEPADITKAVSKAKGNKAILKLKRGDTYFEEAITMAVDSLSGEFKLGLMIKNNITGIGTLTYLKTDGRYGALGHHIVDAETGLSKELNMGYVYNCDIIGVTRGTKGKAGELKGTFSHTDNEVGTIDKNNSFGIFGKMNNVPISKDMKKIKIGSENTIRVGKAYIYTTIDGNTPEYYEINIIKTNSQTKPEEKSMVISITDKRLLEKTGGIVQGMSGSPIIQDNRLIGAVTHVFINDPTKGYGIYINWMLNDNN